MKLNNRNLLLILALLIGTFSRFYGINWDMGLLLHPDERFLTMVTQSISFPDRIPDYFNSSNSTLNPHNVGYDFYVYGTFPIFFVKVFSILFSISSFAGLTMLGRTLSGLLDISTILIVYFITQRVYQNRTASGLSAVLYSLIPLPAQLGHFYIVDTYLTFFISLTFLLFVGILRRGANLKSLVLLGIYFGLAISSKYTALLFLPVLVLGFLIQYVNHRSIRKTIFGLSVFALSLFIAVHLFQPYLFDGIFGLNPQVLADLKTLKSFENPNIWFPPAVQWLNQPKIVFPVLNLFWIGIGPGLFLLGLVSLALALKDFRSNPVLILIFLWITITFLYHALSFSMTGRYFYPMFPFISILSGYTFYAFHRKHQLISKAFFVVCFLPLAFFMSIYSKEHPRIQATRWILSNVPAGSVLSCEEWDDCLPIVNFEKYSFVQLPMYAADDRQKTLDLDSDLAAVDYLVISSNRAFGSITSAQSLYPKTSTFYDQLFAKTTQFKLVAKFASRPTLGVPLTKICIFPLGLNYGEIARKVFLCDQPGITFVDDYSEEAYTVYDHPQVFIFKKSN